MARFAVILPAAGRSTRFGDPKQKKIYADLDGRAVWLRAVEPFLNRDDVGEIVQEVEDRVRRGRRLDDRDVRGADAARSVLAAAAATLDEVAAAHDAVESGADGKVLVVP